MQYKTVRSPIRQIWCKRSWSNNRLPDCLDAIGNYAALAHRVALKYIIRRHAFYIAPSLLIRGIWLLRFSSCIFVWIPRLITTIIFATLTSSNHIPSLRITYFLLRVSVLSVRRPQCFSGAKDFMYWIVAWWRSGGGVMLYSCLPCPIDRVFPNFDWLCWNMSSSKS